MPTISKLIAGASAALVMLPALGATVNPRIPAGLGGYFAQPHAGGLFSSAGPKPPQAPWRTPAMLAQAAPTNQWYSSVMFTRWSEPLFAFPVSYQAVASGWEVGVPTQSIHSAADGFREVVWPHHADLTVRPDFKPESALLAGHGDWSVTVSMPGQGHKFLATAGQGSPFSYYQTDGKDVTLELAAAAQQHTDMSGRAGEVFTVNGQPWAVYGPEGGHVEWVSATELKLDLPPGKGYFSIAALPDTNATTLQQFARHAYAFVTDTRVHWHYDQAASQVDTDYTYTTQPMQGGQQVPLVGLLPNLWWGQHIPGLSQQGYASVRGRVRLLAANHFQTRLNYEGIVPYWPALAANAGGSRVDALLGGDVAKMSSAFGTQSQGTYWIGKGLGRAAQLMNIGEVQGRTGDAKALEEMIKRHFRRFFSGTNANSYFVVDRSLGTTVGYPSEYGSVSHMNDHHFHYGYWILAAAQLALRDPHWADKDQWGSMVDLLVDDIATDHHGLASYPFLRNFDPYEGHSWASGDAMMADGNNQESSSEAVNAWAGLIFWGAATGDTRLRDLGIYLYTTEVHSIDMYWFDLHHVVFAPAYRRGLAAQVFGDKYSYNTWWTQNPREVQGINLLPLTTASTYLGRDPRYVESFFDNMKTMSERYAKAGMSDGTPSDIWQDVFAEYRALADPAQAMADWNSQGSTEDGDSRTHAYYWIRSMQAMGRPDFDIHADTPLYAVFKTPAGVVTHLACNPGAQPLQVHFSDGASLVVAPHDLGVARSQTGTGSAQ